MTGNEMKIIWNAVFRQFEAVLTQGPNWSNDQQSVKSAGFKTEGPPNWVWLTQRALPLTTLRDSKPLSGLTITSDALENYKRLKAQEDLNAAVKAQFKAARKDLKKDETSLKGFEMSPEGFLSLIVEPVEFKIWKLIPPPSPLLLCRVCQSPVYFYESQNPPICLDCEFDLGL